MQCALCEAIKQDYRKVAENEHAVAIIILEPQVPCHSLIIPKRHVTKLTDLSKEESFSLNQLITKITETMDKVLKVSSIAAINGARYQTQPHLHYQILPVDVGLRTVIAKHFKIPERIESSKEDLIKMAQRLKNGL